MKRVLLKHANILDGSLNMSLKENMDIYIEDGIIRDIGSNLGYDADEVLDLTGKYVTPGLINLHVHLPASGKLTKKKVADKGKLVSFILKNEFNKKIGLAICGSYAKLELLSGTTTVRAVGGVGDLDTRLRNDINSGKRIGPRLFVSNTAIGVPGGHMDKTVAKGFESIEDALKFIEKEKEEGIDLVKIMITGGILDSKEVGKPGELRMSAEMIKACTDKAHSLGLKVAAHDEGEEGVKLGMLYGVDTIEHGADTSEDALDALKARGGAHVLTLSPAIPLAELSIEEMGYPEVAKINSNALLKGMVSLAEKCMDKGIPVGLGTDTGCPLVTHYDMWRELFYYTKYVKGVDNNYAIHTATMINAEILGIDKETGSVEKNKSADLVILNHNPLEDLAAYKNPVKVIYKGKIYKPKFRKMKDAERMLDSIYDKLNK